MGLINFNNNNNTFAGLHALKASAAAAPVEQQKQTAPVAPSAQAPNKEALQIESILQGKAQINFSAGSAEMIANWKTAGQATPLKLPELPKNNPNVSQDKSVASLMKAMHHAGQKYKGPELANIQNFMAGIVDAYKGNENKATFGDQSIHQILSSGIENTGITAEQIDMLAKGDFTPEAYVDMVKAGFPIG